MVLVGAERRLPFVSDAGRDGLVHRAWWHCLLLQLGLLLAGLGVDLKRLLPIVRLLAYVLGNFHPLRCPLIYDFNGWRVRAHLVPPFIASGLLEVTTTTLQEQIKTLFFRRDSAPTLALIEGGG